MTIRRHNPKKQGELGVAFAINWFVQNGYVVSIPLLDSQRYDLIVEQDGRLSRVQVKTATQRRGDRYLVELRTMGGNRSGQTVRLINVDQVDSLFVLADDGHGYLVPASDLGTRRILSLGPQAAKYRVTDIA